MAVITNMDAWDRREFLESMEYNPDFKDIEKQGSAKTFDYAEFMTDVFGGLYKLHPETRKPEDSNHSAWMDTLYGEISQLQEWKNLRERTKMNPDAAAIATAKFCKQFMDAIPNTKKDQDQPVEFTQEELSKARRAAREACDEAAVEADEFNNMIGAMGYSPTGNGKPQYASPTAKREVAARLMTNDKLRRIAELAGRMRRIAAEKQRMKTKHGVDELADIMVGDNLARLIPSELAKLAHPLMKMDFRKKYLEKQLLQYRLRGKEKKGKGPVIVCVDESGSMQGNRDIWAKAVALALLQIAQQQKRNFALIHFDSNVTRVDEFSGPIDQTRLMDTIAFFTGGGTSFEEPMDKAAEIINKDKNYSDADIIMITDGSCSVSDEWVNKFINTKNTSKFNVISILINTTSDVLQKFSDHVITLDDLQHDDIALHTMFSV